MFLSRIRMKTKALLIRICSIIYVHIDFCSWFAPVDPQYVPTGQSLQSVGEEPPASARDGHQRKVSAHVLWHNEFQKQNASNLIPRELEWASNEAIIEIIAMPVIARVAKQSALEMEYTSGTCWWKETVNVSADQEVEKGREVRRKEGKWEVVKDRISVVVCHFT